MLGFAPVSVSDPGDPAYGLAPVEVLHWHGDVCELPDGATRLASSAQTENQAFRLANAWGFSHPEADLALVEALLAVPEMTDEAVAAIGDEVESRAGRPGGGAGGRPDRAHEPRLRGLRAACCRERVAGTQASKRAEEEPGWRCA